MYIITVDGKSGSGKGTLSTMLAKELGILHIDNGKIFRAITLLNLATNSNLLQQIKDTEIALVWENDQMQIYTDSNNITPLLASPEVSRQTALLASNPEYFYAMVEKVRELAFSKNQSFISDGRAVGTYIFPEAAVKFYIDAPLETRAERRYAQLSKTGQHYSIDQITQDIVQRDELDINRETAPLKVPFGAYILDTSLISPSRTLEFMRDIVANELNTNTINEIRNGSI